VSNRLSPGALRSVPLSGGDPRSPFERFMLLACVLTGGHQATTSRQGQMGTPGRTFSPPAAGARHGCAGDEVSPAAGAAGPGALVLTQVDVLGFSIGGHAPDLFGPQNGSG
jgi:hypothetical protein